MAREGLPGVNTGAMNPDARDGNPGLRVPQDKIAWGRPATTCAMDPMLSFPAAEMRPLSTSSPMHCETGTAAPAARRAGPQTDIDPDERTASVDLGLAGARQIRVRAASMQKRLGAWALWHFARGGTALRGRSAIGGSLPCDFDLRVWPKLGQIVQR
jgi:hypothetical protein